MQTNIMYLIQYRKVEKTSGGEPHAQWQVRRTLYSSFDYAFAGLMSGRRCTRFVKSETRADGCTHYRPDGLHALHYEYRIVPIEVDVQISK